MANKLNRVDSLLAALDESSQYRLNYTKATIIAVVIAIGIIAVSLTIAYMSGSSKTSLAKGIEASKTKTVIVCDCTDKG